MNTATTTFRDLDADQRLPSRLVDEYRENGFVRVRGILDADEVARYSASVDRFLAEHRAESLNKNAIFTQLVNVWRRDEVMRELTLHPVLARIAEQLAGIPLRLWHDQLLVKEPRSGAATEFHQDRPYWPHSGDRHSLSAWVALVDVPPERGCMTFLPGSQEHTGLRRQDLKDAADLFRADPELQWSQRVTVPLRAGDCTFHSSYTGHMALPNHTEQARLAHVAIYMDEDTVYTADPHPVTDDLGIAAGEALAGDLFPRPAAVT